MRNSQTHFEQVPIELVEIVLQQATAVVAMPNKTPALVLDPKRRPDTGFPKRKKLTASKGKL